MNTVDAQLLGAVVLAGVILPLALMRGVARARSRNAPPEVIRLYVRWAVLLCATIVTTYLRPSLALHLPGQAGRGLGALAGLIGGICAIASLMTFVRLIQALKKMNPNGPTPP